MQQQKLLSQNLKAIPIDITNRCNLKCPHCIIPLEERRTGRSMITFQKLQGLIPVLAKNGCREIRLTGGEPMMHPDFKDIYLLIKRGGMEITLFTNGTFLTCEWLNFFRRYPLKELVITLYGANDREYAMNSFDGTEGLFTRIYEIIKDLPRSGIRYTVQCKVLKHKPKLAEELSEKLRGLLGSSKGQTVFPRSEEDKTNVDFMLPMEEWVKGLSENDRKSLAKWAKSLATNPVRVALYRDKRITSCSAGYYGVHITADWKVSLCTFYRKIAFDLNEYSFDDIFYKKIPAVLSKKIPKESPCYNCPMDYYCRRCIALGYGSVGPSPIRDYQCRYTEITMKAITNG